MKSLSHKDCISLQRVSYNQRGLIHHHVGIVIRVVKRYSLHHWINIWVLGPENVKPKMNDWTPLNTTIILKAEMYR